MKEYLDAIPELLKKRSDLTFLFVGYGDLEVEYREKYSALIARGNIVFTGRVSYFDLPRYLDLADWAIDPKKETSESSGKLMEYISAGLPIFAFGSCSPELEAAILPLRSFDEILLHLEKGQALSPTLSPSTVINFSQENLTRQWLNIYENLQKPSPKGATSLRWGMTVLISAVLIAIFYSFSSPEALWVSLKNAKLSYLGLSGFLYGVIYGLRAIRFSMLSPQKNPFANFQIVSVHTFMNNLLPASIGELTYPYWMKKYHQVSFRRSLTDLLTVRLIDLMILILLLVTAGSNLWLGFSPLWSLLILAAAHLIFFLKFKKGLSVYIVSLAIVGTMFLFAVTLMQALGFDASLSALALAWPLSMIASVIPIQGFFGFGPMEAGWVLALTAAGMEKEASLVLSVNYHLISILFSFIFFAGALSQFLLRKTKTPNPGS